MTANVLQTVPFNDLKGQYQLIRGEILEAIEKVLDDTAYILGPAVQSFEAVFAQAHQAPYCIAVNSGTAALHLVLLALGLGPGDEVILPTNTFFATAEAVSLCGATPVFVDCLSDTCNVDPAAIEAALTPRTKAVIAVHLFGQPADMKSILRITEKHNLQLIEDCAQAHLAQYDGQSVGSFGVAGCFSFYPGKNLGAYGEGGAVVLRDAELYQKMLALRDHGAVQKYRHQYVGHNYRMNGIQGAVLGVKMQYLAQWTQQREQVANSYHQRLSGLKEVQLLRFLPNVKAVHHLYVIRTDERDALMQHLNALGVQTGVHYPIPCHLQKAYEALGYRHDSLPVSEKAARQLLSLPIYPEMTEAQVDYVCAAVHSFFNKESTI